METIWKILGVSGVFTVAVFMQVLSCVLFRDNDTNNTCARHSNVHPTPA
jgi:hypothetical protein